MTSVIFLARCSGGLLVAYEIVFFGFIQQEMIISMFQNNNVLFS